MKAETNKTAKFKNLEALYSDVSDSVTQLLTKIEEALEEGEEIKFDEPISSGEDKIVLICKWEGVLYAITDEAEEIEATDFDWSLINEITLKLMAL